MATSNGGLLSKIAIAKTSLYVFGNSKERHKWDLLLQSAESTIIADPTQVEYVKNILIKIEKVVDNSWKRIFRWQKLQTRLSAVFLLLLAVEIFIITKYVSSTQLSEVNSYIVCGQFGLVGGTIGVLFSFGQNLKIEVSNRLYLLKTLMRPLIGIVSAVLLLSILELSFLAPQIQMDDLESLILLGISAGYSERYIVMALDRFFPKILSQNKS